MTAIRKLQILGSGAADFIQEDVAGGGHYPQAKEMGGKNHRRPSSTLLGDDILIDFNNDDGLKQAGIAPEKIRHLLITHAHFDHFNPANILEFAASLPHPLSIYGNDTVIYAMKMACRYQSDETTGRMTKRPRHPKLNLIKLSHGESFTLGDVRITPVRANHAFEKQYMLATQEAMNYILEYDGTTLLFALDTSYPLPETFDILKTFCFDTIVIDGTFGERPVNLVLSGHLNFKMILEVVEELKQEGAVKPGAPVIANHISLAAVEPHDLVVDRVAAMGITLAYDGMTVQTKT